MLNKMKILLVFIIGSIISVILLYLNSLFYIIYIDGLSTSSLLWFLESITVVNLFIVWISALLTTSGIILCYLLFLVSKLSFAVIDKYMKKWIEK